MGSRKYRGADNLFEGNSNAGVDGLTTSGGRIDESFVVDPQFLVSSMKVIISNTNSGHEIHKEQPQLVIDSIREVVELVHIGSRRLPR